MYPGRGQGSLASEPEKLKTVFNKVRACHAQFLGCDELGNKPDVLQQLKGYINEYLSCVPHYCKFQFAETERVLSRSVSSVADFDPLDASSAFEGLAVFAHNLLDQPWRKDFYKIKLNSGFFIHNIAAHLDKSEEILKIIGYAESDTDDKILILHRPPDMVVVAAVSLDCYVASQESLILSLVWKNVQREIPTYPMVIFKAYQVRKQKVGNIEFVAECLVREAREKSLNSHVAVDRLIEVDADFVHPPTPGGHNRTLNGVDGLEDSFAELLADPSQIMDSVPASRFHSATTILPSPSQNPYMKGVEGIPNTSSRMPAAPTRFMTPPVVLPPTAMSRNGGHAVGLRRDINHPDNRPKNIPSQSDSTGSSNVSVNDRNPHHTKQPVSALKGSRARQDLPKSCKTPHNSTQPSRFPEQQKRNNGFDASILKNPNTPASATLGSQVAEIGGMAALKSSALTMSKVPSRTDIPSLLEDAMMPNEDSGRVANKSTFADTIRNNFVSSTENLKADMSKNLGLPRASTPKKAMAPWNCPKCTFLNVHTEFNCEMCGTANDILVDLRDFSGAGDSCHNSDEDEVTDKEPSGDWNLVGRKTRKPVLPPSTPQTITRIKSKNGGAVLSELPGTIRGGQRSMKLKQCPKCMVNNDVRNVCCWVCEESFFMEEET